MLLTEGPSRDSQGAVCRALRRMRGTGGEHYIPVSAFPSVSQAHVPLPALAVECFLPQNLSPESFAPVLPSDPSSSSHLCGFRFTYFALFPARVTKHSERNPAAWLGTMASKWHCDSGGLRIVTSKACHGMQIVLRQPGQRSRRVRG